MFLIRIGDEKPFITRYATRDTIKEQFADNIDGLFIVDLIHDKYSVDGVIWRDIDIDHL